MARAVDRVVESGTDPDSLLEPHDTSRMKHRAAGIKATRSHRHEAAHGARKARGPET